MGRVLYIFSFLVLFANVSFAQTTFSASGRVLDENNNPLPMASILIFNALDSSFVVGSTTSIDGRFTIKYIKKGNYNIKLTYVGYSDLLTDFEITNSDFVFQDLVMKIYSQDLMQVTVKATQTRITLKGDTIEYNANAYKVNNDAMAEDLLKKMPGISVVNGKVQAQGEDVKRVTIDGNEFFGDDAYIALRNLPAEIISKIQVVEGKSDQSVFTGSMDASTFKLINIITQNPNAKKTFGKLYSGYGTDSRFNVGGNMNFFNENQRVSFIGTTNNINLQNFSSDDLIGTSGLGSNQGGGMMGRPQGAGGISLFGQQASDFLVTNQSGINQTNSIGVNYIA